MLPELLGAFARAHPAIELQLVSANTRAIADLMIGHEIEIALVEGPVDDRRLAAEIWRADSMVLVAAPDHPLAAERTIAVARLAEEVLIVREPGSGSREIVAGALARHGVQPGAHAGGRRNGGDQADCRGGPRRGHHLGGDGVRPARAGSVAGDRDRGRADRARSVATCYPRAPRDAGGGGVREAATPVNVSPRTRRRTGGCRGPRGRRRR